jgi:dienelactone hydrolase
VRRLAAACLAATIFVAPAAAADLASMFGTRDSVQQISLSPDGTKIAYIAPVGDRASAIYVANLAGGVPQQIGGVDGKPDRLTDCAWVANDRLACSIYAIVKGTEIIPASRMISLDADGKNIKLLSQADNMNLEYVSNYGGSILDLDPGDEGSVLLDRNFAPESQSQSNNPSRLTKTRMGYGVVEVDTRSLKTTIVEEPDVYAADFLTDGHGHVRIMGMGTGLGAGEVIKYSYRTGNSGSWRPLGTYNVLTEDGLNPIAVDPQLNAVYALQKANGRQALYRVSLDGSARQELVYAHPQVDVDGVIRIGRSRRPVGVSFATDVREAVYFDPALKQLSAALGRSMPDLPLIDFVDSSQDESKLLLRASSDVDPGRLYVFDKARHQLNEIMLIRPEMEGMKLAKVQSITYRVADGSSVPAYLTLPPNGPQKGIPAIVMPHGGPSARDEWGFDWLSQFFAAAGYGDAWLQRNGFQSWRVSIGDIPAGARWLASARGADANRMAIVGWSYGGYAALQAAVVESGLFRAVVAIAPVTDLQQMKEDFRHYTGQRNLIEYIGSGPHVLEGSPARHADAISAPVLLFHGDRDLNVNVIQSRQMDSALRNAGKSSELTVFPGLEHDLADSQVRVQLLQRIGAFLQANLAPRP